VQKVVKEVATTGKKDYILFIDETWSTCSHLTVTFHLSSFLGL